MANALLLSAFVISTCGLIYELIAGTTASYLLGDSITQFSTVIGSYLFAMGIGSWLSRFIERNVLAVFIHIEILVGLVGGFSAVILFVLFPHVASFRTLLYALVTLTGILVGVEIPLLLRLLKDKFEFRDLVARVFTFDYIGALAASLLFPLALVPLLGLIRTGLLFGLFNILVALWMLLLFGRSEKVTRWLMAPAIAALLLTTTAFVLSDRISAFAESQEYADNIIYSRQTRYQRLVLTRDNDDLRLFINGNLQFSSRDEYRYHEALVHPGMASLNAPANVLVLGGGDGLAVREILKYPSVQKVTLVDLDPTMTKLFSGQEMLTRLNANSLTSDKLTIVNADAFAWLRAQQTRYDFVVIDFPDPGNFSIGKLYTTAFYRELRHVMTDDALAVIQSTSPIFAPKSFWCVVNTLQAAGFVTTPYHAYVPSFGEWGYVLAGKRPFVQGYNFPANVRFVNRETVTDMLHFADDMISNDGAVNRLDNQVLVQHFDTEWSRYVH